MQFARVLVLAQLPQIDGKTAREVQSVGVVISEDPPRSLEDVLVDDAGLLELIEVEEDVGQVVGEHQRSAVILAEDPSPPRKGVRGDNSCVLVQPQTA